MATTEELQRLLLAATLRATKGITEPTLTRTDWAVLAALVAAEIQRQG